MNGCFQPASNPEFFEGAATQTRWSAQWTLPESNRQPPPCKGGALPIELRARTEGRRGAPVRCYRSVGSSQIASSSSRLR